MRFNTATRRSTVVQNYQGDTAYSLTPELELYATVVTSALADKFYESTDSQLARIRALIKQVSPVFVAKLAVYAREKMYLRSVPLVLTVELAKVHSGDSLVSSLVSRVIQRADEITELLAYYQLANGRTGAKKLSKLSKQIQRGLSEAFNKFDEYQFAKYNRDSQVKLRDALFLVHPKGKDKSQSGLFDKIASNTLATPATWEVELSEAGKTGKDKKEVWEKLVLEKKLGYMAMLRNLRNMIEAGVSQKTLGQVCTFLADPEQVRKSKQLPFRFLSAYRELKELVSGSSSMVLNALEDAVLVSAENIKGYDYNTTVVVACDVSGSMQKTVSERSVVQFYDIGLMLGMLLQSRCKSVISGIFGDHWKVINLPQKSILANADELHRREGEVGYSTNGYYVLMDLIQRNLEVEKVMLFTDCQLWDSHYGTNGLMNQAWTAYRQKFPNSKLYLFDLAGYGNTPVSTNGQNVFFLAGWSDKVFDMLASLEGGASAIDEIEKIDL